ncbi:MAG: hypothetical protein ABJN40_02845 [Sneathiella sp.]
MPNVFVKIPEGIFTKSQIDQIGTGITKAANAAEGIPDNPENQRLTWILVEEVASSQIYIGGNQVVPHAIPVIVQFHAPEGVLDADRRKIAAEKVHAAILDAVDADLHPRIASSCMMADVPEGHWGGNGAIMTLNKIAAVVGYTHLTDRQAS